MNRQEIFNRVVEHAKTMNGPSYIMEDDHFPTCAYRGCNGNKCLIGAVLPDYLYKKEMETHTIDALLEKESAESAGREICTWPLAEYFKLENSEDIEFLIQLQFCHDDACNNGVRFVPHEISPDIFKRNLMQNLKTFASIQGLVYND